jgi:predicted small secreted protein
MKPNIRRPFLLLASLILVCVSTGCRTFRGFGQDVSHAGSHIERAAR